MSTRVETGAVAVAAPRPLLRTWDVVSLLLGIVIGAGIFAVPSLVAANSASPGAMLFAWLLGGLLSLAGALCYAELASAYPHSGGEYHFLRLAFGDRLAFLFAWARLTVIPTGSIALLAYVFGDYAAQVYAPFGPASAPLFAAAVIVGLTAINALGLHSGKRTQNMLTLLQVGGVVVLVVLGLAATPEATAVPSTPAPSAETTRWGLVLIFVMLAFGGWNEAAYVSAETLGPGRNLPRALVVGFALITLLYLLLNLAYLRVLGLDGMAASPAVAADMMRVLTGGSGPVVVGGLIALAALASVNATILMSARTLYAFGGHTPAFAWLGRWNGRANAPVNALYAQALVALGLVALGAWTRQGFATMVEYTAPVFWLFFLLTGMALFVLRIREPARPRPFRVPWYPLTPLAFCALCGYLLYASLDHTGIGALLGVGVLVTGALVMRLTGTGRAHP